VPIVTISRQYGSGGSAVAAQVAARLGWQLLDDAIVDAIAAQMGVSAETVRAFDERQLPLMARLADALALDAPEVLSASAGAAMLSPDERIIETTRRVMEAAVATGPVVVVGRGAQVVLGQRTDAIHVFCYAPRDALARRVAEREKLTLAAAERRVDDVNHQRAARVRLHYGRSWDALENYHVCVNTEWLGIDGAVDVVVRAVEQRTRGSGAGDRGSGSN
jgi:cytidylate kinase